MEDKPPQAAAADQSNQTLNAPQTADPVRNAVLELEAKLAASKAERDAEVERLTKETADARAASEQARFLAADKQEELATALADADRRQALLVDVQWSGPERIMPTHRKEPTCPDCQAFKSGGHLGTCRIAAELA